MINNGGTVKWKVEIGCHCSSVAMVTSQKSLFHAISCFRVISFLFKGIERQGISQKVAYCMHY